MNVGATVVGLDVTVVLVGDEVGSQMEREWGVQ